MWFATALQGWSQTTPLLRFDEPVAEIGSVRYDGGPVKVRFTYTNIDTKPVSVLDVHVMCGCTVPEWSRKEVRPGQKGVIDVTYDPSSFIGEQHAHMTVISSNGEWQRYNTITVHGTVLRDETLLQVRHPYKFGEGLRADVEAVGLRLRTSRETVQREISLLNDSDAPMTVSFKGSWRVRVEGPVTIGPHKAVKVKLRYRTWFKRKGEYEEPLHIFVNGIPVQDLSLKGAIE